MGKVIRLPVADRPRARGRARSVAIVRAYTDVEALSRAEARLLGICAAMTAVVVALVQFVAT